MIYYTLQWHRNRINGYKNFICQQKKPALQVSYEKMTYMIKEAPHSLKMKEGKIKRLKSFKYFGERI